MLGSVNCLFLITVLEKYDLGSTSHNGYLNIQYFKENIDKTKNIEKITKRKQKIEVSQKVTLFH